ncbi:hypothetical protein AB0K00_33130 [Dactylosporangium sp. NPDC049525]|uniref:hypothetical protein n=1 Tax=Dactylosporangium sp. NPDC049525 TaxID=3154730 RepID=UPI00344048E8
MSRVEWTRLEGNDVEAVVAMFVSRENPTSVRITPSRGDGGVDILDRLSGDKVYQVKRYCEPLNKKQKDEVEESLKTLTEDPRWASLKVTSWHLVTPWDPSPEAEKWLQEVGEARGLTAVWHGLTYVEQLAAKYGDVVDYYLHGGRGRIQEAYETVSALFAVDRGEKLDVPSVASRIQKALPTLDTDPHYRYELRFGAGSFPAPAERPMLVMTWMNGVTGDGPWVAVDIIARCAASAQLRPITVSGRFVAEVGSDFEGALRDFVSFGTPLTSPVGAFDGEVDAPGGLGGRIERAQVRMLSLGDSLGGNPNLHVQIVDPGGAVLGAADLDRTDKSDGKDGTRVVLEEVNKAFVIEDRFNLVEQTANRVLQIGELSGAPVIAVRSAMQFLVHCHAPNIGRVSVRHTPPELGVPDSLWALPRSAELDRELKLTSRTLDVLAEIQQHTSTPIRVPDLAQTTYDDVSRWYFAARLLRGEEVIQTIPDDQVLMFDLGTDFEDLEGTFAVELPLEVQIGSQRIELDPMVVWLTDATMVSRTHSEGRTHYAFTTPDRTYRCTRRPDETSE